MLLKKLGWWDDLTEDGEEGGRGQELEDRPLRRHPARGDEVHGCHPFGNAKARAVVWNFPDGVPLHREPLYSPRPDMVDKYPTHDDKKAFWRLPTLFKSVQQKNKDIGKEFPLILTSGRLVEYEGGGEETRSNPWLAELQQDDVRRDQPEGGQRPRHPERRVRLGEDADRRAAQGQGAWSPSASARTPCFMPFHFSGLVAGQGHARRTTRKARHPIVRGEAVNTATTYGYDSRDHDAGNQDHRCARSIKA